MTEDGVGPKDAHRRQLLLGFGGIAAGYVGLRYGIPRVGALFEPDFAFEAIAEPAGFRRIEGGASTSGFDPYFGISDADAEQNAALVADVRARLCDTLFGTLRLTADIVPVAVFSDYNCPYCRVLTERLATIEAATPRRIGIAWHELPLLGASSVTAAEGALAAKRQGAYLAFNQRLMQSRFQTTDGYLATLAEDLNIDQDQLVLDMQSADVAEEIARSRALAKIFGFFGTPAMVVGRTVVQGEISAPRLQRLIDRELADGPIGACV